VAVRAAPFPGSFFWFLSGSLFWFFTCTGFPPCTRLGCLAYHSGKLCGFPDIFDT
jgi:hypothetical protein